MLSRVLRAGGRQLGQQERRTGRRGTGRTRGGERRADVGVRDRRGRDPGALRLLTTVRSSRASRSRAAEGRAVLSSTTGPVRCPARANRDGASVAPCAGHTTTGAATPSSRAVSRLAAAEASVSNAPAPARSTALTSGSAHGSASTSCERASCVKVRSHVVAPGSALASAADERSAGSTAHENGAPAVAPTTRARRPVQSRAGRALAVPAAVLAVGAVTGTSTLSCTGRSGVRRPDREGARAAARAAGRQRRRRPLGLHRQPVRPRRRVGRVEEKPAALMLSGRVVPPAGSGRSIGLELDPLPRMVLRVRVLPRRHLRAGRELPPTSSATR